MDIKKIYQCLTEKINPNKILVNEPMSNHTSFKIGGNADILIKVNNVEDIKHVIEISKKYSIPMYVLGNGSNVLVKDEGIRGIVLIIQMNNCKIEKREKESIVTVEAGMKLGKLAQELLKQEIGGFEFASGIPGTLGGAVRMNAGAHGTEMKDIVVDTTYMDYDGNINIINNKEQKFEYRRSIFCNNKYIILQSTLKLQNSKKEDIKAKMNEYANYRKEKQPINYPSAGSTFKRGNNFITAKLIDECGLKGYSIGGAKISDVHAGFIINTGNATAKDVIELAKYTKEKIYEKFKKQIELEIEVIGE